MFSPGKSETTKCDFASTMRDRLLRHLALTGSRTEAYNTFGALTTNHERVDFVNNLLRQNEFYFDFKNDCKSDVISEELRMEGNQMFKRKRMKYAVRLYTNSVACGEVASPTLAKAYANRSAVFFTLHMLRPCLEDIQRARANNYPAELQDKLQIREKNAESRVWPECKPSHEPTPTLSAPNPRIESANDCLSIAESPEFGRHIIATRDIEPGEVLAIERPYACLPIDDEIYSHCSGCLELCHNLIPCSECTQALFCSEYCKLRAYTRYHQYECPILATCRAIRLDKLKMLALRVAINAKIYYDDINTLELDKNLYRSDTYKEVHHLIANTEKRSVADLFERAIYAAIMFNLVKERSTFLQGAETERVFKDLLLLHLQTGPSNFHEVTELKESAGDGNFVPQEIGNGVYSFLSLLNHSCCSNVGRFAYGSVIVLRAIEAIKKGQQCFDTYGYHHALSSKEQRQRDLNRQYCFVCSCEACEKDWPQYGDLPVRDDLPKVDRKIITNLCKAEVEAAKTSMRRAFERVKKTQPFKPCKNFCDAQEVSKQCLYILGNKREIL